MGFGQRRRIEAIEGRTTSRRRIFVVDVPHGDERAEREAKSRLIAERGLNGSDLLVLIQRFDGGPLFPDKEFARS